MLTIHVPEKELFSEKTDSFITIKETDLHLEHSLISLSKWESKWKRPYLDSKDLSKEQIYDYIRCMVVDKNIPPEVINSLSSDQIKEIYDYIADSHTATTVTDRRQGRSKRSNEIITSELIYYWMIYYNIPSEYEKWHLNRLLMLIRVCGVKGGTTNQEMDLNSIFAQNNALHARRRAKK